MLASGVGPVHASDECEIDLVRREIRILGSAVPVGGRAFEVIEILAQSAGELVTKDELINRIWPGSVVLDNTLQVHAAALRKALGRYRGLLKTESRRGYRLLGSWTIRQHGPAAPPGSPQPTRVSGGPPATNLPGVAGRLIGRAAAAQQLRDLVSAYRVVTLTGPGGIGKTTLALKVASGLLSEFDDGGWLVELASLSDPALVPSAVAHVLGLKLGGEGITAEAVARTIGGRSLLLVLDNCEHVIDAAAKLAETVVRLCPRVAIVATSREMFRIDGEYVYRVPPLDVPAPGQMAPDQILGRSAVDLFIERTKELDSDYLARSENLPAIATICRHLDGIPLAIEFAAARAAALGIEQVAASLQDRFALLTSGRRTAVARHRTLRATLDWSYELLPTQERVLLRWLGVFPAGFTIDAAVAVMELDTAAVVDGIANLVAKSLVTVDKSEASTRWFLLETTRSYALEQLVRHNEAEQAARGHAGYFRELFAPSAQESVWRWSRGKIAVAIREIDNVRTALDWCFSARGDAEIGVDLTAYYGPVWLYMSLAAECRDRCQCALDRGGTANGRRVQLQATLGSALIDALGPSEQTKEVLTEVIETAGRLGALDTQAVALFRLTPILDVRGEYGEAWAAAERLQRLADESGAQDICGAADRTMGHVLLGAGRLRAAQNCFERILKAVAPPEERRRFYWYYLGNRAVTRAMLARALCLQGFLEQAQRQAEASLDELRETNSQLSVCRVISFGISRVTLLTGDPAAADQAIALLREAATLANAPFWQVEARFLEGKLAIERGAFADGVVALRDAFEICRRNGWRVSHPEFEGALAEALAGLGRLDEALHAVNDAVASAGQPGNGQRWYVPELLRIKGEALLRHDSDCAEDSFGRAAELAREQGALFWELRVALSVARLRVAQGRDEEGRKILAPVYEQFTEGFATADLCAARAMLEAREDTTVQAVPR